MEELQPLPPLTEKQEVLLSYIHTFWIQHRHIPLQREMCDVMGLRARNASTYVSALVDKGYIERTSKRGRRNLKVTKAGIEKLQLMEEIKGSQP